MREENLRKALLWTGGSTLVVFALGPFLWMIVVSLVSNPGFLVAGGGRLTLVHYGEVLSSRSLHFLHYFRNSLVVAVLASLAVTAVASPAGYAVSRMRFPGRTVVPLLVLAVSMFPQISIVGYLYRIFSRLGMLNTHAALILPYIAYTVPIALWINLSYFSQIPMDLDRAALVDGAGRLKTLRRIILPLALPGIFSSLLLVFIACFNEFLFAIMLTVDYHARTLPVGIALFEGLHGEIPWGKLMAASSLASVPLVVVTLVFQRYIIQGLTGGAVKG